ncbi:hypothetical protein NEOKW01_1952 [Nematocida sp. AWRm80]|nr:hypothetical protein NEOKW01_1952 [Nematocida sp. AWRm80]
MRALKLFRSGVPLSTSAIIELFGRLENKPSPLSYKALSEISPASGDIFIIDSIEDSIADGKEYLPNPNIFHEEKFDVIIDSTKDSPALFRFTYYRKQDKYCLVHYLIREAKEVAPPEPALIDSLGDQIISSHNLMRDILFSHSTPTPSETEEIDLSYWQSLLLSHLHTI